MILGMFRKNDKREMIVIAIVSLMAASSIVFSFYLSNQIKNQEKFQVLLWAKAISEKSNVLKISNDVFQKLREEERKKVEITSKATQFILAESDDRKLALFLDLLKLNNQIPIVYTDKDYKVTESRNIEAGNLTHGSVLTKKLHAEFFKYPPIEINVLGTKNYIFYQDSKIYQDLTEIILKSSDQFLNEITNNSSLLPIILVDKEGKLIQEGNLPVEISKNPQLHAEYIRDMMSSGIPISIEINSQNKLFLYYKNSPISNYIKWFPIALYAILAILIFTSYRAIRNARNYEKNQIWVGMSKETAHQLGTPISSLSAWLEVLEDSEKSTQSKENVILEMKHDVNRLALIADRFSKIGSKPKLDLINLHEFVAHCLQYLQARTSKRIAFDFRRGEEEAMVKVNFQLFEWVIENVINNAVDAIGQEGAISIQIAREREKVVLDIADTGKGILSSEFEKIFEPGYTTKKRGWGLGLSLCKRIVEEYFGGKILVKSSRRNVGTTIRIILDTY